MRHLPSGTVTFLFTDIEGSTRLLQELGDQYAPVLGEHRRILRAAVEANDGAEVDTQGDAFFAAFARASDAVAAAEAMQRQLVKGPIRVRIGLHTGEPVRTEEGYVGVDVHRGARICAAGHGGQVLLSQSTRDLVNGDARDLGEHRLKDLLEPQRLFQLGAEEFPPLKTLNWTNLPVQATPLVGRERELIDAAALLREHRLLTLVGPPGTGKTRLALQLAAEAADEFEQVWWVALQHIRDPDLVESTIAQTLGARSDLADYLRDHQALLLLDNVEQVIGSGPRLAELLAGSSDLKLLATSREPLHLTIEQQYPVPPLPEDDAVNLFSERAHAVRPGFEADRAVADICRRLDGLPLAIELAAARVKLLTPDALLARLEQRLPILIGGAQDMPERQRTLRATIAWSFDLLDPSDRDVFARLSVFSGWTLEAAEVVCDCKLDTLASLVDKSLVREQHGRFSMLETIREYALERLSERGEVDNVRRRHAEYFLASAEARSSDYFDPEETPGEVAWFMSEQDNLRGALGSMHEQEGELERELRLVIACHKFGLRRGYWKEGRNRLESALARAGDAAPLLRARALSFDAELAWRQGDHRGKQRAEAAIALYEELGRSGSELAYAHNNLAMCERSVGNVDRAIEHFELARPMARAAGAEALGVVIVNNLGNLALDQHDFTQARAYFEECAAVGRRLGMSRVLANTLVDLGFVALHESRVDEAGSVLRESLDLCRVEHFGDVLFWAVEGLGAVALERDKPSDATCLLAATAPARAQLGLTPEFYPIGDEMRQRTLDDARGKLGEVAFAAAWAEGEDLTLEAAADKAALVD